MAYERFYPKRGRVCAPRLTAFPGRALDERVIMRQFLSLAFLVLMILTGGATPVTAAPDGQVTWGVHISLAPTWFDPAETSGKG